MSRESPPDHQKRRGCFSRKHAYRFDMETLHVPETVPVMTLPDTVFFPQALLPLHIFEPRYQEMLRDVLAGNRLFAVARLNNARPPNSKRPEPPHHIASVGIIRACQKGDNDTSNLLLQGIWPNAVLTRWTCGF